MTQRSLQLPKFKKASLLQQALTHKSHVNENPGLEDNERLEFLGDAVLNFLSGNFLFWRYPDQPEGKLTTLRSQLVDQTQLAKFAIALDLGSQIRLGKGADRDGGRTNPNLLSSAFEAMIGAYFLDCNSVAKVQHYVEPFLESVCDRQTATAATINFKSRFQEWALANGSDNPQYVILSESGPDHDKKFIAEAQVGGTAYGRGLGAKKQEAEKNAAKAALATLGIL
ncbi:ribonuclease III [Phormidium sp. CLA17]|uniref:ribonuclease III n=1 Tax=Leptolyngbya sp. Cla-17 TaxID=2803751 RepID=UPI001491F18A|nr:ribonuclease III [Leptolyngbya sp. Cla-17]MBM0740427.1 ribonuclease III [Leptolyngbya sp. Cla-17]